MPRKDFSAAVAELQDLQKGICKRQAFNSNPFCQDSVAFEIKKRTEVLCLDPVDNNDKIKLVRWIKKQSDVVVGID